MSSAEEGADFPLAGFRMPAEWDEHAATWIAWPHNRRDWPGKLDAVQWVYGEIVRRLSSHEKVRILVGSDRQESAARRVIRRVGASCDRVEYRRIPTNRAWMRDFGPLFVRREGCSPAIAGFAFNAWARYPDWELDSLVAERIAGESGTAFHPIIDRGRPVVLEGGSIDVDGRGSLLTTEECLLDTGVQARNPGLGRSDIERILGESLGAERVLWLGKGIAGDDTHGHVDDFCRFVAPGRVALCREDRRGDDNYRVLEENRERLEGFRPRIEVAYLPMPSPLSFDGVRLPASYANFYVANRVVLVPTFNDPRDRLALGVLSDLFPDRTVVGIHAVDLVWGFGAIHCLTQQEPAREPG